MDKQTTSYKKDQSFSQTHGKILASWQFPEFIKYKRSWAWYIIASLIALALIIYAILVKNYLFAFIVILIAFVILLYEIKEPILIKFNITEEGLELEDHFYPYKEIKNFWIIYEPPEVKRLYFEFKGLRPRLSIPLLDQNPLKIREIFLNFLNEDLEKEEESTSDFLERKFKL